MSGTAIRNHLGDLNIFSDALVAAESSRQLVERLEQQLNRIKAFPARLHLLDEETMTLYCACAFGCEQPTEELPAEILVDTPDNFYILYSMGDPIGVLEIEKNKTVSESTVTQLCSILGPALKSIERQEISLSELRHLHEERQQFTSAGELLTHVDVDVLLVRILETIMTAVRAQVGAIFIVDEQGTLKPQVVWGFSEDHVASLLLQDGTSVIDAVYELQEDLCLYGEEVGEQIDTSKFPGQLDGLLVLPITGKSTQHGLVLLANPERTFDDQVKRIGVTVCDMAAIALDNAHLVKATVDKERLARDVEIAQSVQNGMFPSEPYEANQLYVAGRSQACDETGGDYYTYLEHDDELYVMIGDVTGH